GRALVRLMVPVTPRAIVSSPGVTLAPRIACRSEPAPLSSRLVTLNVLGTVRSSSTSRRGTKDRRGLRRAARPAFREPLPSQRDKVCNNIAYSSQVDAICGTMGGNGPGRADRAPERCRAGEGVAWRHILTGRFTSCLDYLHCHTADDRADK